MDCLISNKDRYILRELAKKQLNFSKEERNQKRIKEWYLHNELRGERPMIHLETATFEQELIPPRLQCEGDYARDIEANLYRNFLNQELFDDDRVTPDYYGITYHTYFTLFGIDIKIHGTLGANGNKSLGHNFESLIGDLESDYGKLLPSKFGADVEGTIAKKHILEELFEGILPVKLKGRGLYCVPTQMLVHFMSMEQMMFNMYDYPDLFKEMMMRIADDTLAYYKFLEEKNLILPTVGDEALGQGTWCYNQTLPESKLNQPFTSKDVWGFMDSQETVGISPDMFEEFMFPTYKKIADSYGLLSYGCCEPVDPIWERCIGKLDNLRKVSISPWCNEEYMAEQLRNRNIIYHRKPSPNYLGIGTTLDETECRKHIRTSLLAARGCKMEITQRDVYTINHDISKAKHYIDIIKDEVATYW